MGGHTVTDNHFKPSGHHLSQNCINANTLLILQTYFSKPYLEVLLINYSGSDSGSDSGWIQALGSHSDSGSQSSSDAAGSGSDSDSNSGLDSG